MSSFEEKRSNRILCCRKPSINCLNNLQNISLQDLKKEFKKQFKYIWSSVVFNLSIYLIMVIPLIFCGRLGNLEFASASLSLSIINSFCISVSNGLATACDTFFSQMYGSSNRKGIGTVLQRSLLVLNMFSLIVLGIIPNMERVVLAVHVKPDIARLTGVFNMHFLPAVPVAFSCQVFIKYLQNTNHLMPVVFSTLISNCMSGLLCYIFIYHCELGIRGPAIALMLSYYILLLLLVSYVYFSKMYVGTWYGWSRDCLYDWGLFSSLALSGMLHVCLEWWSFEIGFFLAGMLGEIQIGAYAITIQVAGIVYMVPLGLSIAASIRIGHSLGAKNEKGAKTAFYVALLATWSCAVAIIVVLLIIKDDVAKIYVEDQEIISLVSQVIPICVIYEFFDFTGAVCNGALRGSGHQKLGAVVNVFCFYVICIPVGACLMFKAELGIVGLWVGIVVGLIVQGTFLLTYMLNINWNKEVYKAQIRANATENRNTPVIEDEDVETKQLDCGYAANDSEHATQLKKLSPDCTSNRNLKDFSEVEDETQTSLMNDQQTNGELKNAKAEKTLESHDTQVVEFDIRCLLLKRIFTMLGILVIFLASLFLSIAFRPSYCMGSGSFNMTLNSTLDSEFVEYSDTDDCILIEL